MKTSTQLTPVLLKPLSMPVSKEVVLAWFRFLKRTISIIPKKWMKKIEGYPAWCWWSKWFWALVVKPGQMSEKSLFSPGTSWFESKTSTPTYPRNGSRCDCSAPPYFKFNNKKSSNTKMVQLSPDQHDDALKSTLTGFKIHLINRFWNLP